MANPQQLSQLRTRVRFFVDEKVQANYLDSDINYAINEAQQEIAIELAQVVENFFINTTPTSLALVANQQYYVLPDDFMKMTRIEDVATGMPIPFVELNSNNQLLINNPPLMTINQVALGATIVGNSVGFRPVPTAARTLQYWYVPVLDDLINDSDLTAIPRIYCDMIAIQAAIDCMIEDESDTSALERKQAHRWEQLKRTARDRQQQNPKYVRRVSSGNDMMY